MKPPSTPPLLVAAMGDPTRFIADRVWAEDLAMALVDAARKLGASACDATVGLSASLSASARDGAVEDVTRSQSRSAAVRVIVDGRLGLATSSDAPISAADIDDLARTAVALAELSSSSPHNVVLPGASLTANEVRDAGDALLTWDDATALLDPAWCVAQALETERIVRGYDGVSGVRDVSAGLRRGLFALATSTGFLGSMRGTTAQLSCSAVVEDGTKKQVESWWSQGRSTQSVQAADVVAGEAARRVLARRGARRVPSESMAVIFDPNMARGFFGGVLGVICGEAVARKQSYLLDAVGKQVLPPGLVLVDDPLLVGGFASRAFDGEGQLSEKRVIVDDAGRLTGFLLDGRSAARLGLQTTGHASRGSTSLPHASPTNTTLSGGRGDLASIIAETKKGLLVTKMLGRGADATTGDLSRGAAGFYVEDGAIAFPVEDMTIAGNARDMLLSLDRVGADLDERSALRVGTVRFANVSVGGT
ncbi:MAG: TldD/PmbA family protein [Deltaproteobacteria bacterium]|nr:TldD/PmbA family protein [Deltaproteobacteria bacterium]